MLIINFIPILFIFVILYTIVIYSHYAAIVIECSRTNFGIRGKCLGTFLNKQRCTLVSSIIKTVLPAGRVAHADTNIAFYLLGVLFPRW